MLCDNCKEREVEIDVIRDSGSETRCDGERVMTRA